MRSADEVLKRTLDLGVSFVALMGLAPLMLGIACVSRLMNGPPVLFSQWRPGRHGFPFRLWKFRTMTLPRDGVTPPQEPDSSRITPLGRFLRQMSLDELPQLWNVLRGDMSLVGPRPLLVEYLDLYTPTQARRHEVRPGITGWAQVGGRNALSWEERLAMDVWYVDHRGFPLDLRILLLTVRLVLARRGISQPGRATMDRFIGTDRSEEEATVNRDGRDTDPTIHRGNR